ncbi:MCE family protein [Actinomadura geliboluensis]|uniref:MCE family protein n=1 Tax=Actinomadura geliboluensis TaxID=882440 RepID=A0A5S4GML6_9ACTN|nr:MCE family protein [Actinomadura geliboluensis]TMR33821.1 MCE family protein [Actinomadura geliboluensis]
MASTLSRRARIGLVVRLTTFVTVTGVLTAVIGMQIARVDTAGGRHFTATFDDASGLMKGDQVKIAGAPVGQVDEVKVVDGKARVGLTVRHAVRVPADSEAAIRWRDAMGRRVVYLVPGKSTSAMRDGAYITRTRSAVDGSALLDQLGPLVRALDPKQVNTVLVSLSEALDGNAGNIDRLIADIDTLSATIAKRRKLLRQMLDDYATVTGVIARRDKQIGSAVDDLVSLSDAFTGNRKLIDDTLVQLATLARTSDALLAGNERELGQVVDKLSAFSAGVNRNGGTLLKVLQSVTPKLQHIFAAVDNGQYVESAIPCLSLAAPPCPYPTRLPGPREGAAGIDTPKELENLMVGGGRWR